MASIKVCEIDVKSINDATKQCQKLTGELNKANKASNNLNNSLSKGSGKTYQFDIENRVTLKNNNSSNSFNASNNQAINNLQWQVNQQNLTRAVLADLELGKVHEDWKGQTEWNDALWGDISSAIKSVLPQRFQKVFESELLKKTVEDAKNAGKTNNEQVAKQLAIYLNRTAAINPDENPDAAVNKFKLNTRALEGLEKEREAIEEREKFLQEKKAKSTSLENNFIIPGGDDAFETVLDPVSSITALKNIQTEMDLLNQKKQAVDSLISNIKKEQEVLSAKTNNKGISSENDSDNLAADSEAIESVNKTTLIIYQQQYDWVTKIAEMRRREREEAERLAELASRQAVVDQGRANAAGIVADWQFNQLSEKDKIGFQEQNALNNIDQSFNNQLAWDNKARVDAGFDPLSQDDAAKLEQYRIYEEAKTAVKQQATQARNNLEQQEAAQQKAYMQQGLASMDSAMNGLMGIAESTKGRQSGTYKALFAMSKAFHVAQATLNLHSAVSDALSDKTAPTTASKFANMAAVAAAGVNLLSSITSLTFSGQAHAGIDYIPREGTWLLDRGERVVDSRTNADLKQYLRNNNGSSGGGGSVSINVPLSIQSGGSGNGGMSMDDINMLAGMIKSKVFEVVSNEQRPGGILSRG